MMCSHLSRWSGIDKVITINVCRRDFLVVLSILPKIVTDYNSCKDSLNFKCLQCYLNNIN